jgi:hypothetical protein
MTAIKICFEKIEPTPSYPHGCTEITYQGKSWDSRAASVVEFKKHLKDLLRSSQVGRCCYCRRHLGDIQDTHLEHYIEKAAFPALTFSILNLALSCSTCNTKKNSVFLKTSNALSKVQSAAQGAAVKLFCCPVLRNGSLSNISDTNEYLWVHPHVDRFSEHMVIKKDWVFSWLTPKGRCCIESLHLNDLYNIEMRAAAERLAEKRGTLEFVAAIIAESSNLSTATLATIAATEIRRRRAVKKANE